MVVAAQDFGCLIHPDSDRRMKEEKAYQPLATQITSARLNNRSSRVSPRVHFRQLPQTSKWPLSRYVVVLQCRLLGETLMTAR